MNKNNKQAVLYGAYPQQQVVLICGADSSRRVSSAALLGEGETLAIQHGGESYILRQTRAGKLILTK